METLKQVFDQSIYFMRYLWFTMLQNWGIFGVFLIGLPLIRKVAQAFNKLKS